MQRKYTKLLLSLVITTNIIACSSSMQPAHNVATYYSNSLGDYAYCNDESCPQASKFTLDQDEEYKPIYLEPPVVIQDRKITSVAVHYDFSKYSLSNKDKLKIKQAIEKYKSQLVKVAIVGFTDSIEGKNKTFNSKLSRQRAEVVRAYLTKLGVKAADISIEGRPLCCYVSTNKTNKGRALNRRAEVQIFIN